MAQAAGGPRAPAADIKLTDSSAQLKLFGDTAWSLSKMGVLSGNTVTWDIAATQTATVSGRLLLQGTMTVTNAGSGPATIGNVVVNLQKREGNAWVTITSDVANATQGDAATTANIHAAGSSENRSTFSENGASGALEFTDATRNTLFALVPQQVVDPGETIALLFSASFDNNVLNLPPGTQVRAEVIVTFGNATVKGNSTADVDINGNGTIDADEAFVRSVPARLTHTVPAQTDGNATVALTDTLADITTTGTVAFLNAVFTLGATSGTVMATVDGGTSGGTITNCARLTSADQNVTSDVFTFALTTGVNETACSTITVPGSGTPPPTCTTPGTPGCAWTINSMHTWNQASYDAATSAGGPVLANNFNTVYPTDLVLGGTFELRFTTSADVFAFLPAGGAAAALTGNTLNPTSTSAGAFAGHLTALTINVDFSDAGLLASSTPLRDLRICGYSLVPAVNGMTVGEFLDAANGLLGGGPVTTLTYSGASLVASSINSAFLNGSPSTFAQTNLRVGSCTN